MLGEPIVRSHEKPKFRCLSVARLEDVANYALRHKVRHVEDVVASMVADKLKVEQWQFIVLVVVVDGCRIYQRYLFCEMTDVTKLLCLYGWRSLLTVAS